jgi:hypothetical protein
MEEALGALPGLGALGGALGLAPGVGRGGSEGTVGGRACHARRSPRHTGGRGGTRRGQWPVRRNDACGRGWRRWRGGVVAPPRSPVPSGGGAVRRVPGASGVCPFPAAIACCHTAPIGNLGNAHTGDAPLRLHSRPPRRDAFHPSLPSPATRPACGASRGASPAFRPRVFRRGAVRTIPTPAHPGAAGGLLSPGNALPRQEAPGAPSRARRRTRRRTAPPTPPASGNRRRPSPWPSSSPSSRSTTKAALLSRASRVRRTATPRDSPPPPSSTTNPKAPLRSRTSAHHGPCAPGGRAHDPEAFGRCQCGPVGRGQRAPGIDVSNPPFVCERLGDDLPHQRRLPAPAPADDLRQPPQREPAVGEHRIERRDPRADPAPGERGRREDGCELRAEGGQGHDNRRREAEETRSREARLTLAWMAAGPLRPSETEHTPNIQETTERPRGSAGSMRRTR